MLSITQPEQYYQVNSPGRCTCCIRAYFFQVFLAHGLGAGFAAGVTYVPGMAVLSHWFQKRRPLAFGIVTSVRVSLTYLDRELPTHFCPGLSYRRVCSPNHAQRMVSRRPGLPHRCTSQCWSQRGSPSHRLASRQDKIAAEPRATKYPDKHEDIYARPSLSSNGFWVSSQYDIRACSQTSSLERTMLTLAGLYYPFFFIQLNAIKNGLNPTLAFYTVRRESITLMICLLTSNEGSDGERG